MSILMLTIIVCAQAELVETSPDETQLVTEDQWGWLELIKKEFVTSVGIYQPKEEYLLWAHKTAGQLMLEADSRDCPEMFVFADRNPDIQLIMLGFYAGQGVVVALGWDQVSTGNPKPVREYHYTPCGAFANTTDNFSYRAKGTKNSRGWRGFGSKGMRVWDFGWQWTVKPIRGRLDPREIRLLMHATDPDLGQPLLGSVQSKGCVRISEKLNRLLDRYCVLDQLYLAELPSARIKAILSKDHFPTGLEGRFMLVADSSGAFPTAEKNNN